MYSDLYFSVISSENFEDLKKRKRKKNGKQINKILSPQQHLQIVAGDMFLFRQRKMALHGNPSDDILEIIMSNIYIRFPYVLRKNRYFIFWHILFKQYA